MSNRRLDISSLLCNDEDVPVHRPRPTPAPTMALQPSPSSATPKAPFLGLEALVHVATEERRRLSGGSESIADRNDSPPVEEHPQRVHPYQPAHQVHQASPKQIYASVVSSPVHTQSPTYSPYLPRPREHAQIIHQSPVEQRSPMSPFVRQDEELQRFQYIQRQRQEVVLQDQRSLPQRFQHPSFSDASRIMLPPLRSPSMPLQVEDPEQLRSRTSPLLGRPRSGSFAPRYPLSPMQVDVPAPFTLQRLPTPTMHEPPPLSVSPSTSHEPAGSVTREFQPVFHDTPVLYRRDPQPMVIQSPIQPSVSTPNAIHLPHQRVETSDDVPSNKRRRHSDSPMRLPAIVHDLDVREPPRVCENRQNMGPSEIERVVEPVELTQSPSQPVPPPIAATRGPIIFSRPSYEGGKRPSLNIDHHMKERESHKVVTAQGRRSPPGSAVGRAKAAKKIDEMEKSLREAIRKDPLPSPVSTKLRDDLLLATSTPSVPVLESNHKSEENDISAKAIPLPSSSKTKQEFTQEWFIQQFDKPPSPHHPREFTSPPRDAPEPIKNVVHLSVSSRNSASPAAVDRRERPSHTPSMSEEAVASLEQELEELLAEPEDAEENKMDIDVDHTVAQLVAETLDNAEVEDEDKSLPAGKQEPYNSEADVDLELLRLVDDQPSAGSHSHEESESAGTILSPAVGPVQFSLMDTDQAIPTSPDGFPTPSERGSIPPPVPHTSKGQVQVKHEEENSVGKKAGKSSKKKEAVPKSSKSKAINTATKPKTKSTTKTKFKAADGTATPPLCAPKPSKVPLPLPVKKSASSAAASRSRSASVMPTGSVGPEGEVKPVEKQEEEESSDNANDDDKLYCVCKTKYDEERFMIACDKCDEWFHMQCVDMSELEVDLVDQFFCPTCIQRNPQLTLRTTYKQRCLNGLQHGEPGSNDACHKPALGGGMLSKFCSQDCGVEYMTNRIDSWVKRGGKRQKLWEAVKHAEKREGVVAQAESPTATGDVVIKTEEVKSLTVGEHIEETRKALRVNATKSTLEIERLKNVLTRVVKMREEIKRGMEVVLWREKLLELAIARAQVVEQCGWDQRLCFGDEEWAEFGMGVLESYETKADSTAEADNDMQVDVAEDGEWWCPGKVVCDRHAGWQSIRVKDVAREREQKEEALAKLTTRERELRKRIEDLVDPHSRDVKDTPSKKPLKLSSVNGRSKTGHFVQKGKKRKAVVPSHR